MPYTPAFGATGATRKAGPLDKDTAQAISKLPANELLGNNHLKNEKISLDGAEASLLRKLENVQKKKAEWEQSQVTKGYASGSQTAAAKAKATVTPVERKTRRAEDTAEAHQSAVIAVEDQETEDWTPIPTG
jgi:hypothetical protein